jgi:molybdate transport system permease protein
MGLTILIEEIFKVDVALILNSLRGAFFATVLASLVALPTAYLIEFKNFKGKSILEIITILPLGVPPVVTGYLLLILLSPRYFFGGTIEYFFGGTLVFTWIAGSLAASIVSFPLIVRAFQVGMSNVSNKEIASAKSLALSEMNIFISIVLPLSKKGILAGILICFVRSLSEFGATIIVAGNIPGSTQNLSTAIFSGISSSNTIDVVRLSIFSILLAILSITAHNILLRKKGV